MQNSKITSLGGKIKPSLPERVNVFMHLYYLLFLIKLTLSRYGGLFFNLPPVSEIHTGNFLLCLFTCGGSKDDPPSVSEIRTGNFL